MVQGPSRSSPCRHNHRNGGDRSRRGKHRAARSSPHWTVRPVPARSSRDAISCGDSPVWPWARRWTVRGSRCTQHPDLGRMPGSECRSRWRTRGGRLLPGSGPRTLSGIGTQRHRLHRSRHAALPRTGTAIHRGRSGRRPTRSRCKRLASRRRPSALGMAPPPCRLGHRQRSSSCTGRHRDGECGGLVTFATETCGPLMTGDRQAARQTPHTAAADSIAERGRRHASDVRRAESNVPSVGRRPLHRAAALKGLVGCSAGSPQDTRSRPSHPAAAHHQKPRSVTCGYHRRRSPTHPMTGRRRRPDLLPTPSDFSAAIPAFLQKGDAPCASRHSTTWYST
ncbi:hypothetical protein J3A78_005140 [Streptomyces sp. PvR006]|nr:hypothetical protein [Streptomyces sp. PvR006]